MTFYPSMLAWVYMSHAQQANASNFWMLQNSGLIKIFQSALTGFVLSCLWQCRSLALAVHWTSQVCPTVRVKSRPILVAGWIWWIADTRKTQGPSYTTAAASLALITQGHIFTTCSMFTRWLLRFCLKFTMCTSCTPCLEQWEAVWKAVSLDSPKSSVVIDTSFCKAFDFVLPLLWAISICPCIS